MKTSLEALIAALIRLGAVGYGGVSLVGALIMLPTIPFIAREAGTMGGMIGPLLGGIAVRLVVAGAAFYFSQQVARIVCSGLDEVPA